MILRLNKYLIEETFNIKNDLLKHTKQFMSKKNMNDILKQNTENLETNITELKAEVKRINRLDANLKALSSTVNTKVDIDVFNDEHQKIWKHFDTFNDFIKYQNLEDHINEVNPLVEYWKQSLAQYNKDNKEAKQILRRFDEVLLEKASKFTVDNIEAKIRDFWHKDKVNELKQFVDYKNNEIRLIVERIEESIQMNHDIVGEMISESTNEIQQKLKLNIREFLETKTISPSEVATLVSNKADRWDILEIDMIKADKIEIDKGIKMHKIIKNQIQHILIVLIEAIKIQSKNSENTVSNLNNNTKFLLKQATSIFNWMKENSDDKTLESFASPRLNNDSLDQEDVENGVMMSVRPLTTKLNKSLQSVFRTPKRVAAYKSYRSNSTQKAYKNESIIDAFNDSSLNPIVKAKKEMILQYKSKYLETKIVSPELNVQMSSTTYGGKGDNLFYPNVPTLKLPTPQKLKMANNTSYDHFKDTKMRIKTVHHNRKSIKETLRDQFYD